MTDPIRGRDTAAPQIGHKAGHRLVVPEGWVIDDAARDRLEWQLDRAPGHVAGVIAESGELSPGGSYRTHAEWRSLEPTAAVEHDSTDVHGAVMLRSGVGFAAEGGVVRVASGPLLVDPGAHVHDPRRHPGPVAEASEIGRSPFPRRPLVVFAGGEIDADLADWARKLVNRLVRRDVEARLVMPDVAEGLHLTRPCSPGGTSVRALAPDALVTLDDGTAAEVDDWCDGSRSTAVIRFHDDVSVTSEPVSWQLGRSSGRVRGVIGRRADAPGLAALVRRLCAGPQPMPPSGVRAPGSEPVAVRSPGSPASLSARRSALHATFVVPHRAGDIASHRNPRIEGLRDQLGAVGAAVASTTPDDCADDSATEADVVVVAGVDGRGVRELVRRRSEEGRPTVADVSADDLVIMTDAADRMPSLEPTTAEFVAECGLATSSGGAVQSALHRLDVRTHPLPTLLTRARTSELREARAVHGFDAAGDRVLRWHLGTTGLPHPPYVDATAEAVARLLADHVDMRAEVVVDAGRLPTALHDHERVTLAVPGPGPEEFLRWVVHLWTPPFINGEQADDLDSIVEASCSGVPSVMPAEARQAVDGHVPAELVVADPDEPRHWADALGSLVDDEQRRVERSREAFRQSDTVQGPGASKAAAQRFLGWVMRGGEP